MFRVVCSVELGIMSDGFTEDFVSFAILVENWKQKREENRNFTILLVDNWKQKKKENRNFVSVVYLFLLDKKRKISLS